MADQVITSDVFVAYSQCPRKAFLLLFSDDQGTPHDYPRILEERRKSHQTEYLYAFRQAHRDAKQYDQKNLRKSEFFVEATLRLECCLNKQGIFTVHQLSYLFKPKRNRKKQKGKIPVKHSLELQALVIREKKIYIQELPELTRKPIELFLDIEGIPDQHFYYLMGLLVCDGENKTYHAFWANTTSEEEKIWRQLIEKLNKYPEAPIYHYGNYELRTINELAKKYLTDHENIKKRLINMNSSIYGKVYFPIYSNSLKELGNFIGISWESINVSGLETLAWRCIWEDNQNTTYKHRLIDYNKNDCEALNLLTPDIFNIKIKYTENNIILANHYVTMCRKLQN